MRQVSALTPSRMTLAAWAGAGRGVVAERGALRVDHRLDLVVSDLRDVNAHHLHLRRAPSSASAESVVSWVPEMTSREFMAMSVPMCRASPPSTSGAAR